MFIEFNFTDGKANASIALPCPAKPNPQRPESLLIPRHNTSLQFISRQRCRATDGRNSGNPPALFWRVRNSASPITFACRQTVDEQSDGPLASDGG